MSIEDYDAYLTTKQFQILKTLDVEDKNITEINNSLEMDYDHKPSLPIIITLNCEYLRCLNLLVRYKKHDKNYYSANDNGKEVINKRPFKQARNKAKISLVF